MIIFILSIYSLVLLIVDKNPVIVVEHGLPVWSEPLELRRGLSFHNLWW